MCTLIAKILPQGFIMSMNRDNPVGREYTGYIETDQFIYPLVEDIKGTWLGVSKKGEVYAILDGKGEENPHKKYSRGKIVPKLLAGEEIDPKEYDPFQLFTFDGKGKATYLNWDGKHTHHTTFDEGDQIILVSSSYGYEQAKIDYVKTHFPSNEFEYKEILLVEDPQIFLHETKSETIGSSFIEIKSGKVLFQNSLHPYFTHFEEFRF